MSKGVIIGKSDRGPVSFVLETLLRTRLLIQANSGGGKSWLIRLLAELLFGKVQVIIIDREGEFSSLRPKYGYLHVGQVGQGADIQADIRSARLLAEKLLELGVSAICDLYEAFRTSPMGRRAWVAAFLEGLVDAPKALWHDCIVVVDEAHQFCPQESPKAASMAERETISRCKDAMVALATVGRKRGLCAVWATQRLAKLDKDASAELFNRLVGMTIEDVDVDRAVDLMSVSREDRLDFKRTLRDLDPGNFFAFGRAVAKERTLFKVNSVTTKHQEAGHKGYNSKPPPVPEVIRTLLPKLADLPKEVDQKAKTEAQLREEIRALKAKLAARPASAPVPPPKPSPHDERIVEVPVMGKRELRRLEKLVDRVEKAKSHLGFTSQSLEIATRDIAATIDRLKDGKSTNDVRKAVGLKPIVEKPKTPPPKRGPAPVVESSPEIQGISLDKAPLAILSVLANYPEGCRIEKLALLSGYRQSGGFRNALAKLRTGGYMEGPNTGTMKLTDKGREIATPSESLIGEELVEYWLEHPSFGSAERKVLQALVDHPDGLTVEELASASGYEVSGGFRNTLSTLRTAGVMVGRNTERMRLCGELLEAVGSGV